MDQAGAGNHDGQVKERARRSGQILAESRRATGHRAWWFSIQEHRNDTHRSSLCLEQREESRGPWLTVAMMRPGCVRHEALLVGRGWETFGAVPS